MAKHPFIDVRGKEVTAGDIIAYGEMGCRRSAVVKEVKHFKRDYTGRPPRTVLKVQEKFGDVFIDNRIYVSRMSG